jgi:hypothetical protein
VWFWRPDAGAKFAKTLARLAGDGGKKARSPGRARISRNTIAQGRPDDRPTCGSAACFFVARGPWVSAGTRPSLRPLCFEGCWFQHLGHSVPRERRVAIPSTVMPREGGASSTQRPLGSNSSASGILVRPVEPGDDERGYRSTLTERRRVRAVSNHEAARHTTRRATPRHSGASRKR